MRRAEREGAVIRRRRQGRLRDEHAVALARQRPWRTSALLGRGFSSPGRDPRRRSARRPAPGARGSGTGSAEVELASDVTEAIRPASVLTTRRRHGSLSGDPDAIGRSRDDPVSWRHEGHLPGGPIRAVRGAPGGFPRAAVHPSARPARRHGRRMERRRYPPQADGGPQDRSHHEAHVAARDCAKGGSAAAGERVAVDIMT